MGRSHRGTAAPRTSMARGNAAGSGPSTRLVYSTGGELPEDRGEAEPEPARPDPRGIRLGLESRPSGRTVTVVRGLAGTPDQIAALARSLRAACGAGGAVKDGVVEVQGDHREAIAALLAARGLRARRSG